MKEDARWHQTVGPLKHVRNAPFQMVDVGYKDHNIFSRMVGEDTKTSKLESRSNYAVIGAQNSFV